MERIMSDPVGSGVNSFVKVLGVLDHLETSKQKRELMAQQEADRRIQQERQTKLDTRQEELWKREDEQYFGRKNLGHAVSAYSKMLSTGDKFNPSMLSPEELSSVLPIAVKKGILKSDGTIDNEKINSISYLDNLIRNDPALQDAMQKGQKASIDILSNPGLSKSLESVYGDSFSKGTDKYGNESAKKPSKIFIDFSNKETPTITFGLNIGLPKNGVGNLVPIPGYENNVYDIPEAQGEVQGRTERGNIDLAKRKVAINKDGSISTVLSRPFNFDGKEVLLPLVSDSGKIVSDKEAIDEYKKTGKHLGIFDTPQDANQYAEKLHNSSIWKPSIDYYVNGKDREGVMTWGRNGDPNAPVQQIPAPLLSMQIGSLKTLAGLVRQLEAEYGATPLSQKVMQSEESRKKNADAYQAYQKSDGDSKKFVELMVASGADRKEISEYQKIFDLSSPELKSSKGKELTDLAAIEKKYGKDSPQAKQMRDLMGDKKKSLSVTDLYMKAAGGDAKKARQMMTADKIATKSSGGAGKKADGKISASDFKRANDDFDEYWITEYGKNAQTEDGKKIDIKQLLNSKSKEDDDFTLGDNVVKGRFNDDGKPLKVKELYEYGKTQLNSYLEQGMKPSRAYTQARKDISEYGSKKSFLKKSGQEEFHVEIKKPKPGTKLTDKKVIGAYMKAAGGDKKEAAKLATADGWDILK